MQTLNEVEILGRKYSQFNEFLDAIPKVFNIFVDTSAVYFFPHKNGNSIDFLFKAAKDPENPISNKKNKYELIKAFYDHIDYLNKISKKRDIFVTLEIRGEIQKSLKRIKKMIKSNPLEIKIKKRKIYFKYKSDRRKRTNKRHRRSGNRKVTNQYFKMSKPDKRQFYSNKYLYLFREIKKSLSNLKGNLKIAQNLEGQQNFDLTKEFF